MKKFTKILICLMLCVFSFGFVACDNRTEDEKNFTYPSSSDSIYGNGGLAVQKGNYVYFVNGYKSVAGLNDGNKKDSYLVGSLMLMKLGNNGQVVTDDGLLDDDYYITMSNALCGYEATNLFIHGDYLYFVTPSLENETGDKVWAKERVNFNRIKLNKKGKVETVYSSGVQFSNLEFEYYDQNGSLFILVHEKGDSYYEDYGKDALIRVDAGAKSSGVVANNVSSVAFADNGNEIFFVQDDAANSKYSLKKYNVSNNNVEDFHTFNETFMVKFVCDEKVYILKDHKNLDGYADLMVSSFDDKSFAEVYSYKGNASDTAVKFKQAPDNSAIAIVVDKSLSLIINNEVVAVKNGSATDIIGFTNGCVVYYETTDNNTIIKKVSYSNYIAGTQEEPTVLATLSVISEDYACFDLGDDDDYVYFYNKIGNNYYLNRLKVNNNLGEAEEMFGVYESADAPVVDDDVEDEDED